MTDQEFEDWLDRASKPYGALENARYGYVVGARAAWDKAQEHYSDYEAHKQQNLNRLMALNNLKQKVEKLAEALDSICSPLNQSEDVAYEIAYQALKEYRGYND